MTWTEGDVSWFNEHATKEARKDKLKLSDRAGNVIGAMIALACALYFVALYDSGSGFFAEDITSIELGLFFWVAFIGIVPSLARAFVGFKNVTRPLDIIVSISLLVAVALLISTFPFDFDHLGDSLPEVLKSLVSWIDDGIAKFAMWLAIIVSVFNIPYTAALYLKVRNKLRTKT